MHFSSSSGINELMQFSHVGYSQQFCNALRDLPYQQAPANASDILQLSSSATSSLVEPIVHEQRSVRSAFVLHILLWVMAFGAAFAIVFFSLRNVGDSGTGEPKPLINTSSYFDSKSRTTQNLHAEVEPPKAAVMSMLPTTHSVPNIAVRESANIRSAPSVAAAIVGVANAGEKFSVFGRAHGWVQVGTDRPIGWIAASRLTK